jgi:hypothetical protein
MNWKSDKIDEVSKNRIWKEALEREQRTFQVSENFSVNPRRLTEVAEKPNTRPARFLNKEEALLAANSGSTIKLRTLENSILPENEFSQIVARKDTGPTDKYSKPLTTSQELGWNRAPIRSTTLFNYPKTQCAETKFANELVKASVKSPSAGKPGKAGK